MHYILILKLITKVVDFLDITKVVDFRWKNANLSKRQGVCHVIYMFVWSSLGKV